MKTRFRTTALSTLEVEPEASRDRCRSERAWRHASDRTNVTVLAVNVDIGSHNRLFIRGQGGGLRWDKGEALTFVNQRTWVWSTDVKKERLEFQFLLNDEVWERGEIHVLEEGHIALTPDFEWPEIPRVSFALSHK